MNSKNIKVVDEHGIDRDASVMLGFELDGSGYVIYSIDRDNDNSNIFISKVLKNFDNTFSMIDIDSSDEKNKLVDIVKMLITSAVESQEDRCNNDFITLNGGKTVKFLSVIFNKEQRINVQKTYITTVKKEVVRVVEKYYDISSVFEKPKTVNDIFPEIEPVNSSVNVAEPVVMPSTPVVEVKTENVQNDINNNVLNNLNTNVDRSVNEQNVSSFSSVNSINNTSSIVEPIVNNVLPENNVNVESPVIEPIKVENPLNMEPVLNNNESINSNPTSEMLVFNASKETNLNEALGEVASTSTIPVENIEPIREFGVEQPVVNQQVVVPQVDNSNNVASGAVVNNVSKKAGFVNHKFFSLIAISFFLASCIFLGYEVFNYFQLTK